MGQSSFRIPLETAEHILATFGITRPTPAYERWLQEDGFDLDEFHLVLAESPFVFTIDWRAVLEDELKIVAQSLARLGIPLQVEMEADGNSGFISCGQGQRACVAYTPNEGPDFEEVFRALQSVVPDDIEFRASPDHREFDGWEFAVLPRDEWAELEHVAPEVIHAFFRPLRPKTARAYSVWERFRARWNRHFG